ncbi:MAG: biopolymer transporter ExbD, partial [Acidobacteriota bacterium]
TGFLRTCRRPPSRSTSTEQGPVVGIAKDGTTYLNGKKVNIHQLGTEIHGRYADAKDAYVRADASIRYEQLAQVLDALAQAKVGVMLVSKPADIPK